MVSQERTIETQLLRVFVATAKHSGITAAADALGLAKSAVSKQLSALEALLQVRLFERSSRRMALTAEGRLLLPRAESILAELDHFIADAQQRVAQVGGTVRIAASPEFGAFLSEHFLPVLLARHEALKVVMPLAYRFDDLHDPDVDLAFRLGSLHDDRLVGQRLGDFHRVLVCSPGYAKAMALAEPEDLGRANALLFSDRELTQEWQLRERSDPARHVEVQVHGNVSVQGFGALAAAAVAGLGVARLPSFVAGPRLHMGQLVRVLPRWQSPPTPVYLAYRFGISKVGRVRAVIDAAAQEIPTLLSAMLEA